MRIDLSLRSLLAALAVVVGVYLTIELKAVLLTLLVALVLAGTVAPAVEAMERHKVPRGLGIAAIFVGLLGFVAVVGLVTVPALMHRLQELLADAPTMQSRLVERLSASRMTAPLARAVAGARTSELTAEALRFGVAHSPRALSAAAYGLTAVVLALYMVADRDRVRGMAYALVPRQYHLRLARIVLNLETIVGGYMRGQLLTSLAAAVFTFALLSICRVPNALPVAVFAGLTDVLPFIGGILATAPALLAAAPRGVPIVVVVLVAMVVYQEFESRLLVPAIYGRVLRLAPVTVLVALLVGGELLGILGALLALPVAAGLRMILTELRVSLPGDDTDDTELRARDERAEHDFAERAAGAPPEQAAAVATEMASEIRAADADDPAVAAEVPITGGEKEP